ncbi:MAG: DUF1848 domain-containing protein [Acetatifactor sp.]|nr:DUF1848 domain-containing protein [Acetatifactor sp.]
MILNTGSGTDIPAYYSDWFYNRIKQGYVFSRNPYYPTQIKQADQRSWKNAQLYFFDLLQSCSKLPNTAGSEGAVK